MLHIIPVTAQSLVFLFMLLTFAGVKATDVSGCLVLLSPSPGWKDVGVELPQLGQVSGGNLDPADEAFFGFGELFWGLRHDGIFSKGVN
jgi:hypothetical protein